MVFVTDEDTLKRFFVIQQDIFWCVYNLELVEVTSSEEGDRDAHKAVIV